MKDADRTPRVIAAAVKYVAVRSEKAELLKQANACRCSEESAPDEAHGDGGVPRCYRSGFSDEEESEWCDACRKRQGYKNAIVNLRPRLNSAWGKLKRAAAKETV